MRQFDEANPKTSVDFVGVLARSANWPGDEINLFRALPQSRGRFHAMDFVESLDNLGVRPVGRQTDLSSITANDLPCICPHEDGGFILLKSLEGQYLTGIEEPSGAPIRLKRLRRPVSILSAAPNPHFKDEQFPNSLSGVITDLLRSAAPLFGISLLINILALTGPLLVLAVYDTVIPSNAPELLWSFVTIVSVFLGTDFLLRWKRGVILSQIGTAAERRLNLALFTKLLTLPMAAVTRSTTQQQVNRIRQFESVKEVFAGSLVVNMLDFPFILLFLTVIFAIAPSIGFLLLLAIVLFVLVTVLVFPKQRRLSETAAARLSDYTGLLHEVSDHAATMRHCGLSNAYLERADRLGVAAAEEARKSSAYNGMCQNFGQILMGVTTIIAIAYAAFLAMTSQISFGALIAVSTLTGRILGPVNILANSILKIKSLVGSVQQINRVLALDTEFLRHDARSRLKKLDGSVSTKAVFIKFEAASEPSLAGVSLDIAPNSLVVLAGKSGAGKTTLLKAISKMNHPASGSIFVGGINLKQITVDDLRNTVSLNLQQTNMFDLTLRENLLLGNPVIEDEELLAVYEAVGASKDLRRFYKGLDTDFSKVAQGNLTTNVLGTMATVRSLAKPATVYLLDDAFSGMTAARTASTWSYLKELSKTATVVVTTQHLQHLQEADQVLLLDRGRLVLNDTGTAVGRRAHDMLQHHKNAGAQ